MAKYTLTTAKKKDKIYTEGFKVSKIDKSRFKLGTQEDANKFNKGGVQIIPLRKIKWVDLWVESSEETIKYTVVIS